MYVCKNWVSGYNNMYKKIMFFNQDQMWVKVVRFVSFSDYV
jgi:hypothetical protein